MSDYDLIQPPSSVTVDHEHKPVLYQADGRALVRQAGFTKNGETAMQTSGTYPQLNTGKKPKGKGKRGC